MILIICNECVIILFVTDPWRKVPGANYYNAAVRVSPGTNLIVHRDSSVAFMCLFYGFDDRESLGFPIGMKLAELE